MTLLRPIRSWCVPAILLAAVLGLSWSSQVLHAAPSQDAAVVFEEAPSDSRLYPRDAQDNALLRISGEVVDPGADRIVLEVLRDGQPWSFQGQPLFYGATEGRAGAPFNLVTAIRAGFHKYTCNVYLRTGRLLHLVVRRGDIVCGDVFLVNGQSNAKARDYWNEKLANANQSIWVRSFGNAGTDPAAVAADEAWYMADGEADFGPGTIGSWPLRLARQLSDAHGVPVAVLNGAVGSTRIREHQPNIHAPYDLDTIYGRLLHRTRAAGVQDSVRAILWHQGESDSSGYLWARDFATLHAAWKLHFPGIEKIYVCQTRKGCGTPDADLPDAQRRLQHTDPDVAVMSSNALVAHDGCHWRYAGYEQLGDQLARLMSRDLYGAPPEDDLESPDVLSVKVAGANRDQLLLTFRQTGGTLVWDAGCEADFVLTEGGPNQVVGGQAVGHQLLLDLDGPCVSTRLAYQGHSGDGPWITNLNGVGILSFAGVPIP